MNYKNSFLLQRQISYEQNYENNSHIHVLKLNFYK